jgi:hypothetical protein
MGPEVPMVELTREQQQALDAEQPVVDPRTGQEYRLVKREVYEQLRRVLKPYDDAWDDPVLDVYEEYRDRA